MFRFTETTAGVCWHPSLGNFYRGRSVRKMWLRVRCEGVTLHRGINNSDLREKERGAAYRKQETQEL